MKITEDEAARREAWDDAIAADKLNAPGGGSTGVPAASSAPADEWAIVELFGHVRHVGKIFEVERFGGKMLRIDCPVTDGSGKWTTHFVGDKSIYRLTLTDEATVMARVERARALPAPHRYVDDADDDGY